MGNLKESDIRHTISEGTVWLDAVIDNVKVDEQYNGFTVEEAKTNFLTIHGKHAGEDLKWLYEITNDGIFVEQSGFEYETEEKARDAGYYAAMRAIEKARDAGHAAAIGTTGNRDLTIQVFHHKDDEAINDGRR